MITLRKWALLIAVATAVSEITATAAGVPLSTRPADVTLIQTLVRVNPNRAVRLRRIRDRIARPRPLPRSLARQVTPALVMVAAAGELDAGTFVVSVAFVNRSTATAGPPGTQGNPDLEDRFARATIARLIGVDVRRKRASVTYERGENLLSTAPSASFCAAALPPTVVNALSSPVLHVEGAPIVPILPGFILRSALGLGFRACGQALPHILRVEDVDRLVDEFVRSPGTTTSTLPEECDGSAQLESKVVTDPAYPGCIDVDWVTPIPGCADDVAADLVDAATGQHLGPVLFGHSMQVPFFGYSAPSGTGPIHLVVRVCNGEAGSPGGANLSVYPIVTWG